MNPMNPNTPNLLPAVRAFAQERIRQISQYDSTEAGSARINELRAVLSLVEGLEQQALLFSRLLTPVAPARDGEKEAA